MPHGTISAVGLMSLLMQASLSAAPGDVDPTFNPRLDSFAFAVSPQPDGKIVVGGNFRSVNATQHPSLTRLTSEGFRDRDFNPLIPSDIVYTTTTLPDGKIVIGGNFQSVNGTPRNNIARLRPDGTLDAEFVPDDIGCCQLGTGGGVLRSVVQPDGQIVIAGDFISIAGSPREVIARLNATGALDRGFSPAVSYEVYCLALQPDGKILIGGSFSNVNLESRALLARLNPDGTTDTAFNPGLVYSPDDGVQFMAVQADGKILVGGSLVIRSGAPITLARLHADGSPDAGFQPDTNLVPSSVALQADGKIIVGGFSATGASTPRRWVQRLHPNGQRDESFASVELDAGVLGTMIQGDGKVLIDGFFLTVGGLPHPYLARLENDPATGALSVPNHGQIRWLRGGTAPEIREASFDSSIDGGQTWVPLGLGHRIPGGWELTNPALPPSGRIRARGPFHGGYWSASTGWVETSASFADIAPPPTLVDVALRPDGSFRFGFAATPGKIFTVVTTSDLSQPPNLWTAVGTAQEVALGRYEFIGPSGDSWQLTFYQVREP